MNGNSLKLLANDICHLYHEKKIFLLTDDPQLMTVERRVMSNSSKYKIKYINIDDLLQNDDMKPLENINMADFNLELENCFTEGNKKYFNIILKKLLGFEYGEMKSDLLTDDEFMKKYEQKKFVNTFLYKNQFEGTLLDLELMKFFSNSESCIMRYEKREITFERSDIVGTIMQDNGFGVGDSIIFKLHKVFQTPYDLLDILENAWEKDIDYYAAMEIYQQYRLKDKAYYPDCSHKYPILWKKKINKEKKLSAKVNFSQNGCPISTQLWGIGSDDEEETVFLKNILNHNFLLATDPDYQNLRYVYKSEKGTISVNKKIEINDVYMVSEIKRRFVRYLNPVTYLKTLGYERRDIARAIYRIKQNHFFNKNSNIISLNEDGQKIIEKFSDCLSIFREIYFLNDKSKNDVERLRFFKDKEKVLSGLMR